MKSSSDIPARMGLALPLVALGAVVLEANFGKPTCFGRACIGAGSGGYNEILLGTLAIGSLAALRTLAYGASRWMGALGLLAGLAATFTPRFVFDIPALRHLWP